VFEEERKTISYRIFQLVDNQIGRLSHLGHRFEVLWQYLGSGWDLETVGDLLSRQHSKTVSFLFWILQPIGMIFYWLIACLAWLVQHVVNLRLVRLFKAVVAWSGERILRNPCSACLSFIAEFFRSRQPAAWQYLTLSTLLAAFGMGVGSQLLAKPYDVGKRYRQAVDREIENGNVDRVYLYQLKLAQMGISYGQPELEAIHQLEKQGNLAEAMSMAEKLAPSDRPGMAAAHLYQVISYLRNDVDLPRFKANQLAERHLQQLQTIHQGLAEPDGDFPAELSFLYASLRLNQNRIAEGLDILEELSPDFWQATITSLEVNAKVGRPDEAVADARNLARLCRLNPAILPQLSEDSFSIWYRTLKRAENVLQPVQHTTLRFDADCRFVVEHWCHRFPTSQDAAVSYLLEWNHEIEFLARQGLSEKTRAAAILNRLAVLIGSTNRNLLAGWLFPKLGAGHESSGLWATVRMAASESTAPPCLLELVGSAELAGGNYQAAYRLLKRFVLLQPDHAIAWNNLAVLIKRYQLDSIEAAFDAATRAVELAPENTAMRLTRAMMALELKNWPVAKCELQRVLCVQPDQPELHRYLAMSHRGLGEIEQYHFHQLLAGQ
jgi:tetratricopeptide (TPR) repeat protein